MASETLPWILISIVGVLIVLGIAVFWMNRKRKPVKPMPMETARTFFLMGVVFMAVGYLTNNLMMGRPDLPMLFHLGAIFFIIGLAGLGAEKSRIPSKVLNTILLIAVILAAVLYALVSFVL